MELKDEPMGEPAVGEVRVQVEAIGLNFADVFTGLGLYGPVASGEVGGEEGGFVPGLEFAGVVEKIGNAPGRPQAVRAHGGQLFEPKEEVWQLAEAAAQALRVGDRVMGAMRFGAYASCLNVPANQVRKIPDGWSFEEGAALPVQTITVLYALKVLGRVRSGETVLIHSAAGGCGLRAIAICLKMGVKFVGTVGSPSKRKLLLERFPTMKAEQIVVRGHGDLGKQLLAALAAVGASGFDIILDAVLGSVFQPGYDCLSPGGRYVCFGAASMTPQRDSLGIVGWAQLAWQWLFRPLVDPLQMPGNNRSVMGFNLIYCFNDARALTSLLDDCLAMGLEKPLVGRVFGFEEAVEALRTFRGGQTTGKVVLRIRRSTR